MMKRVTVLLAVMGLWLTGCDGLMTGEQVQTQALVLHEQDGYAPLVLNLSPDMSPVAINFRAEHGDDPAELGKWNSYHVTLSLHGAVMAENDFSINHSGSIDSPMGATYVAHTILRSNLTEAGAYTLRIVPIKPVEVTLTRAEIEVRRQVQNTLPNP